MPRRPSGRARTQILHVRLAEAERDRLRRAALAEYLDESAFARRAILQALDRAERRDGGDATAAAP